MDELFDLVEDLWLKSSFLDTVEQDISIFLLLLDNVILSMILISYAFFIFILGSIFVAFKLRFSFFDMNYIRCTLI